MTQDQSHAAKKSQSVSWKMNTSHSAGELHFLAHESGGAAGCLSFGPLSIGNVVKAASEQDPE